MINLEDTESAFEYKSKWELKKAHQLFTLLKNPSLVKIGSMSTKLAMFLKLPIKSLVRNTIFQQFCGGENVVDCRPRIKQLAEYGIGTILDYSVEGQEFIDDFEKNKNEIIQTVYEAANNDNIPFAVFKLTGLGRADLIKKASVSQDSLEGNDKLEFDQLINRVDDICRSAYENNVPIFVDAEHSWFQNLIDDVVELMISRYNKKTAIVYNTIQLYRHDALDYMKKLIKKCEDNQIFLGLKLVRGAYMEKERDMAAIQGLKDPIHVTKASTDRDYDLALEYCINKIDFLSICAGTHNENSSLLLTDLMKKYNLINNDPRIHFA